MLALAVLTCLAAGTDSIDYPKVLWHAPGALGRPTVTKDSIYSGGFGLFRLDPRTGQVLAVVDPIEPAEDARPGFVEAPAVHGDLVIARRSGGDVVAYDLELQNVQWTWGKPRKTLAHAGALAGEVYLIAQGQRVIALDAADGSERWSHVLPAKVEMTPAFDDERVYVGTWGGSFHALDLKIGTSVWTYEGAGPFGWTNPVVADGRVYVGDRGIAGARGRDFNVSTEEIAAGRRGALHAFEGKTGKHLWGRVFGATGLSKPFVDGDDVFAGFGRSLARFDRRTGKIDDSKLIRTGTNPFGSPTVVGKRIYFGNLDGHLYAHAKKSGNLEWAFQVPDAQVHDFVHTGDRIFVSSTKGLFALGAGRKVGGGRVVVWQK